jgi:hypothetical protein
VLVTKLNAFHLQEGQNLCAVMKARVAVSTHLFHFDTVFILIGIVGAGVRLGPLSIAATNRPIVPAPANYYDGEIGEMFGRGNRSAR